MIPVIIKDFYNNTIHLRKFLTRIILESYRVSEIIDYSKYIVSTSRFHHLEEIAIWDK